jgi:hypothetical protein
MRSFVVGAATSLATLWMTLPGCPAAVPSVAPGVADKPCPSGSLAVEPDSSIQDALDRAGDNAAFCLRNGVYRLQVIRPKRGQHFYGEGRAILNGSRLLTAFSREGPYWVASGQEQHGRPHGNCAKTSPACAHPESFFIDDNPLTQVLSKESIQAGQFYHDYAGRRLYFVDDPTGRKVEFTVAAFAFGGGAPDVLISNVIVEKYGSIAQKGAIEGMGAVGWTVENCEVRLNSGGGLTVGTGGRVHDNDIHHNGQIGIGGVGRDILIENNRIWANNTRGFNFNWEAGGVKLALSDGVVLRGNHVYDNNGSGLWCDINCRNVLYEDNLVERNQDAGIFHEISFNAAIRNNIVRHNGNGHRKWLWGPDILVAASQDVEVYGNVVTVSAGGCGIMLIDQGRPMKGGGTYKTRNNTVRRNETTFEGAPCAGGASDTKLGDENFTIITDGNNVFDANVYRAPLTGGPARFAWGHAILEWEELRQRGVEPNGALVLY